MNLPSVSGTRAEPEGTPTMNKGSEGEYKVTDATALIFQKFGLTEGDYKFVESIDIKTNAEDWVAGSAGITSSHKLVAQLTNVDHNKNSYSVLILLNNKKTDGVKIKLPTLGQSYSEWNNKAVEPKVAELATDNGFYMANAPLKSTTATAPTTLVPISTEYIYPSKEKAEAGTSAADVYVERGVAKMTVKNPGTITVKDRQDKTTVTKSTVKFENWALDITNKKAYAVHNVDGLTNDWAGIWSEARFTGNNNRVYWAKDPNYDKVNLNTADATNDTERGKEFNFIDATTNIDGDFAKPAYCLENTFNLANMYQGQTTRVIFKATYTPKDADDNSLADADGTFYTIGNLTSALNTTKLEEAVNKAAESVLAGYTVDITTNINKEGSHVITCADIKKAGTALVATDSYSTKIGTKTGAEIVKAINDALGLKAADRPENVVGINTYAKGVTYYIARVKHFGELTKWESGNDKYGTGDEANKNYLGRYGMLRNNWYDMTVGNVYGPGFPGVPPVDPTQPDDEDEKYLSVSVKILDWAKRSQKVDL
uniref:Mfa1 family fimbria major subunit n=1 Tax=Alloprevotella sp. TaxID=1872471 RepID=UPI003FEE7B29